MECARQFVWQFVQQFARQFACGQFAQWLALQIAWQFALQIARQFAEPAWQFARQSQLAQPSSPGAARPAQFAWIKFARPARMALFGRASSPGAARPAQLARRSSLGAVQAEFVSM